MVEDSKEDKKKESKTPLLSANLSYPTRPYVAQMPALIRLIGHYTDSGRSMPQAGSPEAETAFRITYQHGFVFLRQLAVHLRTAIQTKKAENIQGVYNWQFIHALSLWTNIIGLLHNNKEKLIQQLVHPLTELIVGTIRLIPTARYYPLRFHCIRLLIKLTELTTVFVPVLPFLLEMFDTTDFNKRHKTASLKAQYINFDTSLKLTKLQMDDRAYKDGLMDQFYELAMLYLVHYAHHVTFPELVYPLILKCKKFIKICKVQNFVKVIRGLLEKVQENVKLIEERRQKTGLNVKDAKQMNAWLEQSQQKSTSSPLVMHFGRYKSMRQREVLEDIAQKEKISQSGRSSLPDLIRPDRQVAGKQNFKSMMEKDLSDNEEEQEELFQIKTKRKHDEIEENQEEEEQDDEEEDEMEQEEEDDTDEDDEDDDEDVLPSPPKKKRHAKMSNGKSSTSNADEFLSIVKKKFDRRKDRVKDLMVEDSKEDKKKESKTPLLSANLSYPTRPYVAQMPALIRLIGHYTDSGRSMPQAGSPEAETAFRSHQEDEQEQQLVYNQDTQPIEVINPFVNFMLTYTPCNRLCKLTLYSRVTTSFVICFLLLPLSPFFVLAFTMID
ncbi:unnamed protein product [Adineta steineri]|uniref:Nucleolar complex protein 2 homolog n=1 Tax=Adineta steineri TaxID=433720 RepID=A0A815PV02_9BILA|nr:unnamed protein product [Adineta steineri]